jgi:hypothetical protein
LRDKFTFKVGAGLTIRGLRIEALDSTVYYDVDPNIWGIMPWITA